MVWKAWSESVVTQQEADTAASICDIIVWAVAGTKTQQGVSVSLGQVALTPATAVPYTIYANWFILLSHNY